MFSCDFCQIFKSTFFTEPLRVTGSSGRYLKAYQNDISSGNNGAFNDNTITLNVFLSFAMIFGSCHPEQPHKILEIFKRNVCGGVLLWHETIIQFHGNSEPIVVGIHNNFAYDRSSRSQVFLKKGVLKKQFSDLQLY